jgi:hypothetical protein
MDTPHSAPGAPVPQSESRWAAVINWLALLMLLAGSIVWPP